MHSQQVDGTTLRLLHADAQLLVFDKPPGLLSVPGRGDDKRDCLSARAQRLYADALVVHRLDMATSGLLLMARGKASQAILGQAFASGAVHKRYEALVQGEATAQADAQDGWSLVDLPIQPDWPRRPRQMVAAEGRPSRTRWRLLQSHAGASHLELEPLSGRSHQLRVHLQAIGHPILGDALYAHEPQLAPRLMLHATELRLAHPASGAGLHFRSPSGFSLAG